MHDIASTWAGYAIATVFVLAYGLVVFEEIIELRKSKPMVLGGCLMWAIIGLYENQQGQSGARQHLQELIGETGALFFFLLVAMTYINAMDDRRVFQRLRALLISRQAGFRALFWATGGIAFCLAPLANIMTTALLMSMVAIRIGGGNTRFSTLALINIVVAANAGGVSSPFGDITTLMVWAEEKVSIWDFFRLLPPSLANWLVPAFIMHGWVPREKPEGLAEQVTILPGGRAAIILGIITIAITVGFHQFLRLPPFLGMLLGLGLLMVLAYYLKRSESRGRRFAAGEEKEKTILDPSFDLFRQINTIEFDTLLFFVGVLLAVGALQYAGFLAHASRVLYGGFGPTSANVLVGALSAIVDNIPLMFAVLKMNPEMGMDQWLLITLTTGVGGSLLSVGSAAGVAAMGVGGRHYTFLAHLRWTPAIAAGYLASIGVWWLTVAA